MPRMGIREQITRLIGLPQMNIRSVSTRPQAVVIVTPDAAGDLTPVALHDTTSAREVTLQQILDGIRALGGNTDGLETLAQAQAQALALLATYTDQVETLLSLLGGNTDGLESLLAALGFKDDNVLTKLTDLLAKNEQIRLLIATPSLPAGAATQATLLDVLARLTGTLSVKTVAPPVRQSVIRTLTGLPNIDLTLTDVAPPELQACNVFNLQNQGATDLLLFTSDNTQAFSLGAGLSVAGDFRLSDLKVRSSSAVKLAVWGGKDT